MPPQFEPKLTPSNRAKPAPTQVKPPVIAQPKRYIDKQARLRWLKELGFAELDAACKDAIVNGDLAEVKKLITEERTGHHSLQLAALFGKLKIARALANSGKSAKSWPIIKWEKSYSRQHEYMYRMCPMNLAIGAQQNEMIRFLHHEGNTLGLPRFREGDLIHSHSETAPPR